MKRAHQPDCDMDCATGPAPPAPSRRRYAPALCPDGADDGSDGSGDSPAFAAALRKRLLEAELPADPRQQPRGKRRREMEPEQESSLDAVAKRVVAWLVEMAGREGGGLPGTRARLESAIAPLCRHALQVDARVVLYHLIFNHVVAMVHYDPAAPCGSGQSSPVDDECRVAGLRLVPNTGIDLAALRSGGFTGIVPSSSSSQDDRFSDEFVEAFWRAAAWVQSNRSMPQAMASLLPCLEQVCVVRRDVPAREVVDALMRRGVVAEDDAPAAPSSVFGQSRLLYSLPPYVQNEHYLSPITSTSV
eukprot:m51a1_g10952 hypothetical protein (303) ;mRNA; f:200598-201653